MFQPLLDHAKERVTSSIEKLVARGVVAIPFLIALGFATAALTIKAIELWGAVVGCLAVAALYLVAATVLAAFFLGKEERESEELEAAAKQQAEETSSIMSLLQTDPVAALSALGTNVSILRMLGRNSPLLLMVLVVGIYLWTRSEAASKAASKEEQPAP
jgi:hypothetical protein